MKKKIRKWFKGKTNKKKYKQKIKKIKEKNTEIV